MSAEPFEIRDGRLNLLNAAMTPSQQAAFSEGFCEPCRQPLRDARRYTERGVTMTAAQCPKCLVVYFDQKDR